MESMINNLSIGFGAVFALEPATIFGITFSIPMNIVYAFFGCFIGTMIGVLPGLGPVPTIALLLPTTYVLPPLGGLIMLSGIYYGAQYGGSTTAILVNLPGETSSVATCLDGHQMARRGRAGVALTTAAVGSFFAGCVGTLLLAAFAVPLAGLAYKFGPWEYFSLMVLGLVGAIALANGSLVKALCMILVGLILGVVGTDVNTGVSRYTFGSGHLSDGIDFVAIALGVFGFAEIISNLEKTQSQSVFSSKVSTLFPTRDDIKRMIAPILRGTALGSVVGILPGAGASLAAFSSYALERKLSKNPDEFGKGAIEGVAGPESANNACAQTSFIPLLALGIPPTAVMALLVGAMMVHNITPGPQVMSSNPTLFWGLVVSMWVGNLMLVILNLPLVGIWVKFLSIPYRFLFPSILVFSCIGVYSINNSAFDLILTAVFGAVGYLFRKLDVQPAPLLLGFVLGPMMEEHFRRALLLSEGQYSAFVTRPISAGLLITAAIFVIVVALPALRKKREVVFQEG